MALWGIYPYPKYQKYREFSSYILNIINVFKDDKSLTFISDLTQRLGAVYDS